MKNNLYLNWIARNTKKISILFFFVFHSFSIYSQTCPTSAKNPWEWPSHSNWFIGNGLKGKFSGTSLTIFPIPNITSYEGTTGASDDKGNLLFLANGRLLWDSNGNLKYAGLLEGNEGFMTSGSASQGAITVRHPLDTANYYIFTVDDANQGVANGLNYFSFDRKGNLKSGPISLGGYRTAEGITATRHANGVDLWVTVYASGTTDFYTYLITCTGVVSTPVISSVAPNFSGQKERGGLAFSWDGKYFAQVHPDYSPNSDKEVSVYKFDNKTGIISDPHDISDPGTGDSPYDVLFSPDNTKLYFSTATGTLGYCDITSWNTAIMSASYKPIAGVSTGSHSAIEIGGDGNLYMATLSAGLGKLAGTINTGTLTYSNIAGAVTNRGLPTMYLPPYEEPDIQEVGPFCVTDPPVDLSTVWICSGLNAEDSIANPNAYSGIGIINTWTGIFSPSVAGIGTHMIIFQRCNVNDTIFILVKACSCPDTTLKPIPPICANVTIHLNNYTITTAPGTWSILSAPSGSTAAITGNIFYANYTVPGNYTVVFALNPHVPGCPDSSKRTIVVNSLPIVTASSGTICSGKSATLTASGANTYTWSTGTLGSGIIVSPTAATSYTVTGTNANGCTASAAVTVTVTPAPVASVFGNMLLCTGDATTLTANGGGVYSWSNGNTTSAISVTPAGTASYSVVVTNANGCTAISTATVTVSPPPIATISGNNTICAGSSTVLTATGGGNYLWNTNAGTASITVSPSSTSHYSVVVSVGSCKDSSFYTVTVLPVPVVTVQGHVAINIGDNTTLTATGGGTYSWAPATGLSCTNCSSPVASPQQTTQYCVYVKDTAGCMDFACVTVTVQINCKSIYIPNAFSPNGDGENDVLYVYGNCILEMQLLIYNRWGEKVYEGTDPTEGWDGSFRGQPENSAVFAYYLTYKLITDTERKERKKGNISLIR